MFSFGSVSQTAGFEVVKALPLSSTLIFSKINGHADVAVAANTKIQFTTGGKAGDMVQLVSDGTGWYVEAFVQNYAGVTFDN